MAATTSKTIELFGDYSYVLWVAPVALWCMTVVLLIIYYKLLHRSKNLGMIGPGVHDSKLEYHALVCCCVKHCSFNFRSCCCSIEDVDQQHECSRATGKFVRLTSDIDQTEA